MATQPPLPGMGRNAVLGKKKKKTPTQPALPGMGSMKKQKAPEPEVPVEKPSKAKKQTSRQKLHSELSAGHLPMFMTAKEITTHLDMGDANIALETPLGGKKHWQRKAVESGIMNRKLQESKRNSADNAHWRRSGDTSPSMHERMKETGYIPEEGGSLPISTRSGMGMLKNGHHRVAAMRNLSPNQFLPVRWNG